MKYVVRWWLWTISVNKSSYLRFKDIPLRGVHLRGQGQRERSIKKWQPRHSQAGVGKGWGLHVSEGHAGQTRLQCRSSPSGEGNFGGKALHPARESGESCLGSQPELWFMTVSSHCWRATTKLTGASRQTVVQACRKTLCWRGSTGPERQQWLGKMEGNPSI